VTFPLLKKNPHCLNISFFFLDYDGILFEITVVAKAFDGAQFTGIFIPFISLSDMHLHAVYASSRL
jgi:hypothetical protein